MNVFVTGATGVIGRRLVPLLLRDGHVVTAVARSCTAEMALRRQGATPVRVDLLDRAAVLRAVAGNETVVNLATHIPAPTPGMLLPWAWRENDRLRRDGAAALVDACLAAGVSRYVQESFAPAYPDCGTDWIAETTPLRPIVHNRTLVDAEAAAERFRQGGDAVVLRFGTFYGADAVQTADLIAWIARGWAPLPGSHAAYISSISHDDAATAVHAALQLPSGVYNVVDDEPLTHAAYVEALALALRAPTPRLPPGWLAPVLGPLGRLIARSVRISNRKIRAACAWRPSYASAREGLRAIVARLREVS